MRVRTFLTCLGIFLLAAFAIPLLPFRVEAQPSHGGTITRVRPVVDGNVAIYDGITGFFIGDSGVSAASISTNSCSLPTNAVTGDMVRYDGTNWLATSGVVPVNTTSVWDITSATMSSPDASWHVIDISTNESGEALVPVGAKTIYITTLLQDDDASSFMLLKGTNMLWAALGFSIPNAGIGLYNNGVMPIMNQKLSYYMPATLTNASATKIRIVGIGY